MTLLATVTTHCGRVRLHRCKDGRYETRRQYRDLLTDGLRDCRIRITAEQAVEWWRLCEERGCTFAPFPAEVVR